MFKSFRSPLTLLITHNPVR